MSAALWHLSCYSYLRCRWAGIRLLSDATTLGRSIMNRPILALLAGSSLLWTAGCATKSYVRNENAPLINKTNELDDITAKNTRDLRDVDTRAQKGIEDVNARSSAADQRATAAAQSADQAQNLANQAVNRV